jgi:hypothetical protein
LRNGISNEGKAVLSLTGGAEETGGMEGTGGTREVGRKGEG